MSDRPALGLQIGDSWLQMARVDVRGVVVESYGQIRFKEGIVVKGEIKDKAKLTEVIRMLMNQVKPRGVRMGEEVVLGISEDQVFWREFSIPLTDGKQLAEVVETKIKSFLPSLPGEVETDWEVVGENASGEIEILMVAVSKLVINAYMEVVKMAGLKVVIVEPMVMGSVRVLEEKSLLGKNQVFLYIGSGYGEFVYVTSGRVRISNWWSSKEVEKQGGLKKMLTSFITYVNSKHPEKQVKEILVSGEVGDLAGFASGLKQLGLPVAVGQPKVKQSAVGGVNGLQTVVGLSLATISKGKKINLLPDEIQVRDEVRKVKSIWLWGSIVLVILSIFLLAGLWWWDGVIISDLTGLGYVREQLKAEQEDDVGEIETKVSQLNSLVGQLDTGLAVSGGEEKVLTELVGAIPEGVRTTSVLYERGAGSKERLASSQADWAITGTADSRNLVLSFYRRLTKKQTFMGGRLYFGSLEKDQQVTFRIVSNGE